MGTNKVNLGSLEAVSNWQVSTHSRRPSTSRVASLPGSRWEFPVTTQNVSVSSFFSAMAQPSAAVRKQARSASRRNEAWNSSRAVSTKSKAVAGASGVSRSAVEFSSIRLITSVRFGEFECQETKGAKGTEGHLKNRMGDRASFRSGEKLQPGPAD